VAANVEMSLAYLSKILENDYQELFVTLSTVLTVMLFPKIKHF
jgi:hypothetical protein